MNNGLNLSWQEVIEAVQDASHPQYRRAVKQYKLHRGQIDIVYQSRRHELPLPQINEQALYHYKDVSNGKWYFLFQPTEKRTEANTDEHNRQNN